MIRIHPKVSRVATCALLAIVVSGGCRSTSSGIGNPFLAPDRVAPPSTRALAPGQAQPYYQGDPLPVMQSATWPAANNALANDNVAARSASGRTLAWNTPGGAAPIAVTPPPATNNAVPWGTNPQSPIAAANEPAVSVPTDADTLRFALPPAASPTPATPVAAAPAPVNPQLIQAPAVPASQGVQLASYNVPVASSPSQIIGVPPDSPRQQINSPWRTPQVMQPSVMPAYGTQTSPLQPLVAIQPVSQPIQPQIAYPTNPMAVQLRAVPSPPPAPGDPMPRIRIPGYDVPEMATADGFRPRTSMR